MDVKGAVDEELVVFTKVAVDEELVVFTKVAVEDNVDKD